MQRWEIKHHWLPVELAVDTRDAGGDLTMHSFATGCKDGFTKAWAEAESLANEGWELVSVSPHTSGVLTAWVPMPNEHVMVDHARLGQSYGAGCFVHFVVSARLQETTTIIDAEQLVGPERRERVL